MQFLRALNRTKPRAELIMQRVRVITHDFKAAALSWAFRPEGADNDLTSAFYRTRDVLNVGDSLLHGRQKMKYGPGHGKHRMPEARVP